MRKSVTPARSFAAAAIFALLWPVAATRAQTPSPEAFYANRNVDFIIGSAAGGGYAVYANVIAHHIGKHIPGSPRVVPRTMEGAGSLTAANQLFTTLPKDGSVFGAVFTGAIVEPLIGDRAKARYDSRKFGLIGSANRETAVCFARKDAGVASWKDVFQKKLIVGGAGWASSIRQYPAVLNKILGTKFEIVTGYPGSKEAVQAVEKNEVQGVCGIQWSSFAPTNGKWVDNGDVIVFGQIAACPISGMSSPTQTTSACSRSSSTSPNSGGRTSRRRACRRTV
jgi:tripartite-type tricarboxylate transporter receptor subunit TctC